MRVVVVGGGFGGLASAARLAKLGHEVTLLERLPVLGGALVPTTVGGYSWDTADVDPAARGRPRPVPQVGPPGGARAGAGAAGAGPRARLRGRLGGPAARRVAGGPDRGLRRARARARAAVGRPRRVVRRRLGGPAPRLPRGALDARGAAEGGRRPARLARGAAPAAEEALQGRAAAPGRRAPVRRRRATTRATCPPGPGWSPTSSSASAPGPSRAAWACSRPR